MPTSKSYVPHQRHVHGLHHGESDRRGRPHQASIPELKERITKTIDFIKGLKPAQIDGTDDKEITIKFPSRVSNAVMDPRESSFATQLAGRGSKLIAGELA